MEMLVKERSFFLLVKRPSFRRDAAHPGLLYPPGGFATPGDIYNIYKTYKYIYLFGVGRYQCVFFLLVLLIKLIVVVV
jgi:hypothetical protein